jgi:hypothetical protein
MFSKEVGFDCCLRVAASSNKALHRTAIPLRSIAAGELGRWTKPWRADGEGFIAFTQGTDIVKGSPDKSGSSTNKMKLTSRIFLGCAVAAYLNVLDLLMVY